NVGTKLAVGQQQLQALPQAELVKNPNVTVVRSRHDLDAASTPYVVQMMPDGSYRDVQVNPRTSEALWNTAQAFTRPANAGYSSPLDTSPIQGGYYPMNPQMGGHKR